MVTLYKPSREFELQITGDVDWTGTRVGFNLAPTDAMTRVRFYHTGWASINEHYRISSYCWAMYLRLLKRFVETGEIVPYDRRLGV